MIGGLEGGWSEERVKKGQEWAKIEAGTVEERVRAKAVMSG
jgi:hypothetical protein